VLIFITALSHAAAKSFNARWRPLTKFSGRKQNQIICEQQTIDLAISNRDTLIGFNALVYPVQVNYEM